MKFYSIHSYTCIEKFSLKFALEHKRKIMKSENKCFVGRQRRWTISNHCKSFRYNTPVKEVNIGSFLQKLILFTWNVSVLITCKMMIRFPVKSSQFLGSKGWMLQIRASGRREVPPHSHLAFLNYPCTWPWLLRVHMSIFCTRCYCEN